MEQIAVRYCAICGEVLIRRQYEKPYKFGRRKTCGRACGGRLGNMKATAVAHSVHIETLCIVCQERPQMRDRKGRVFLYCDNMECREAVSEHRREQRYVGWPRVEPVEWPPRCFAPHNIDFGDVWALWRTGEVADRQSYTGSTAAWAAGI